MEEWGIDRVYRVYRGEKGKEIGNDLTQESIDPQGISVRLAAGENGSSAWMQGRGIEHVVTSLTQ